MQPTDADLGDDLDFPTTWAVPLDEPPLLAPSPQATQSESSEPGTVLPFAYPEADTPPPTGFHPRLRRFDEAA